MADNRRRARPLAAQGTKRDRRPALTAIGLLAAAAVLVGCRGHDFVDHVTGLETVDGQLVAEVNDERSQPRFVASDDGGLSWRPVDDDAIDIDAALMAASNRRACVDDGCFRVVPGERLEERTDAGWVTAWAYTEEDRRRLALRGSSYQRGRHVDLVFHTIVTAPGPDGDTVPVVAMGSEGVLRRSPETGRWEQHPVLSVTPADLSWPSWIRDLDRLLAVVAVAVVPLVMSVGRPAPIRQRLAAALALMALVAVGALPLYLLRLTGDFPANYPAYGSAAGLMSVIAVGATAFAIRGLVRSYPAPSPDHMVSAAP
ncbi:MAG: hypothetical protein AAGD35_11070, partial [Actinomycetota bacterium]